jgi:hypothetical protein
MKNRLTWPSRSHRGYTDSFVLIDSFGSRFCLLLCSHTQEAVGVSGHSEPDLGQVVCSLDTALLSRRSTLLTANTKKFSARQLDRVEHPCE